MSDSTGSGFPTKNIQRGHVFFDLDENSLYVYVGGDPTVQSSWRLLSGVFGVSPDTSQWGIQQSGALWFDNVRGRLQSWDGSKITDAVPNSNLYDYRTLIHVQEDFLGGTSGTYWVRNNGAQSGVGIKDRPGVTRLDTGATSGTVCAYFMGSQLETIDPAYDVFVRYIMQVNTPDANTTVRIGMMVAGGTINPPANGAYFEKLDADTTWFVVTRGGGVETRVNTGITVSTDFIKFEIEYTGTNGVKKFYANDQLIYTSAPNQNPFTASVRAAMHVINSAAVTKAISLDYAEVKISGFAKR